MKAKLINKSGTGKDFELPKNFSVRIREDILSKVVEALKDYSAFGAKPGAGAQYSASGILKHKRHDWKSTYGKGISRIPRKIFSRHGSSFNWAGATVSNTRGGRRPHAPRAEKNMFRKINQKEFLIAMNTALTGTFDAKSLEKKYGAKVESVIFSSDVLEMKTKDFIVLMEKVFGKELMNKVFKKKKIRAGIGKLRGRKYKSNAGMLFVLGDDEEMKRKGIDVVKVSDLSVGSLAPNGAPGRIVGYTEKAIKQIEENFK